MQNAALLMFVVLLRDTKDFNEQLEHVHVLRFKFTK